jgi:hypothetical protein
MSLLPWLPARLSPTLWRRAAIGFLIAFEVSGWAVALASCSGTFVFGAAVIRARRRHVSCLRPARALAVCLSFLAGLAVAETLASARKRLILGSAQAGDGGPRLPRALRGSGGDDVTLVVMGESSAVGIPYESWFSIGRILTWQLEQVLPRRQFRLELLAEAGATLEQQHEKLKRLTVRPDVLIVYSGHNEFISRIPWSHEVDHYLDDKSIPAIGELLFERARRASSLCDLIRETADKFRIGLPPTAREHRPLIDVPAYTPAEADARLADFRRRLEAIVAYAERVGAIPVLIIPPANDADFEPSRSFLPAATSRAERIATERAFRAARRLESSDAERAMAEYRALLAREPDFAEAHYRLALLLDRSDAREEAYRHFVAARDCDGLPIRCLSSFQEAYRDAAAGRDCLLIDGQALFHAIGPRGLLGDHLFHDSVHPAILGHVALAQAILDGLHARKAFGWPAQSQAPRIDPATCARRFGLKAKDWARLCERGGMFYNATAPLRYDPSSRRAKQRAFFAAATRIASGEAPESVGLPNVGIRERGRSQSTR